MTPTPAENDANRLDYRTLVAMVQGLTHRVTRLEQILEMPEPRPELPEWMTADTKNDLLREMVGLLQELVSLQRESVDHEGGRIS